MALTPAVHNSATSSSRFSGVQMPFASLGAFRGLDTPVSFDFFFGDFVGVDELSEPSYSGDGEAVTSRLI